MLRRTEVVKDFGILIDSRVTFKSQINQMIGGANSWMGFIKRQAKEFVCPYVTRSLYCTLIRPILEYRSAVWDPVFEVDKQRLESVQKQFLLFALRHLPWGDLMNVDCRF